MKPRKILVTSQSLERNAVAQFLYQRKYDGAFAVRDTVLRGNSCRLAGEVVKPKSGGFLTASDLELAQANGGEFYAVFDVLSINGQDMRRQPLRERWGFLTDAFAGNSGGILAGSTLAESSLSPLFFNRVILDYGEGVCAKDWESDYYTPMFAAKHVWEGRCRVSALNAGTNSVCIADIATDQPRGRVSLFGGKADRVQVGSVIKVMGMGLTREGKVREPRIDNTSGGESWLVKL